MPSRLARRNFQAFKSDSARLGASAPGTTGTQVVTPPFMGFVPDLNPEVVPFTGCPNIGTSNPGLLGYIAKGSILKPDKGWARLEPTDAQFALGEDSAAFGTGALNANDAADAQQSVNRAELFRRRTTGSGTENLELVVVTADSRTNGSEVSHLFKFDGTNWIVIGPNSGSVTDILFQEEVMPDSVAFPLGVPSTVDGSVLVIATGVANSDLMYYPRATASTTQYDNLTNAGIDFGSGAQSIALKAQAVASYGSRLCCLNVSEGGVTSATRLRFSIIGNAAAFTGNGQGSIDAIELNGIGLALQPLQDQLVGYFSDGIIFYRRTFNDLAPFEVQYISKQVGLLGTHSVVRIDEGLHFIISDRGWFFLTADGNLREVGLTDVGGVKTRKFTDTFYSELETRTADRIQAFWDPFSRLVRISWPDTNSNFDPTSATTTSATGHNNRIWNYDPFGDRVFPDTYEPQEVTPRSWAISPDQAIGGGVWGDPAATGTILFPDPESWDDIGTSDTWGSIEVQAGSDVIVHGSSAGRVYAHRPTLTTRESDAEISTDPTLTYSTNQSPMNPSDPIAFSQFDRLDIIYRRGNSQNFLATVFVDDQSELGFTTLDNSSETLPKVEYITGAAGGIRHGFQFRTVGQNGGPELLGFRYRYRASEGEFVEDNT